MTDLFLKIVNMSISATWFALAVLLLRVVLKKAPKWVNVLLWGLVAVRLICPFSPESILSLIPSAETVSPGIMLEPKPSIQSGIYAINSVVNPVIGQTFAPSVGASVNPLQIWIPIITALWILGAAAMISYCIISYLKLRKRINTAVLLKDNIYQSENIPSPFVLGIFKPRIYLPFGLSAQEFVHIIAHEKAHIKRRDHWWKPFSFALLTLHWLNPVMWLVYALLCRDIELACDEKVIKQFGHEQKACYSQTLLSCSVNRRIITACPIAFGEVGVKERVKSVLNYKKPRFWVIVLAIAACVTMAACFLTNPKNNVQKDVSISPTLEELPDDYSLEQAKADGYVVMEDNDVTSGQDVFAEFVSTTSKGEAASVRIVNYYTLGDPANYDEEFYESIKDDYPKMFVHDLVFDGLSYTIRWYEEGEEIVKNYRYLMHYEGEIDSPYAIIKHYNYYVLIDDNTYTWDDIMFGMYSSQFGDYIDHFQVYSDYIYKDEETSILMDAVTGEILDHHQPKDPDGLIRVESHAILDTEYNEPDNGYSFGTVTVYALVMYQAYSPKVSSEDDLECVEGSYYPAALTFALDNVSIDSLIEYWMPRDGSYYTDDIRNKFPEEVAEKALNAQEYVEELSEKCKRKALNIREIGSIDDEIAYLLDVICSTPVTSSNPNDYLNANLDEYYRLIGYGEFTLSYCFEQFIQGNQTDLRGHIMAAVCERIFKNYNEELPSYNPTASDGQVLFTTGQDWFNEVKRNAERLHEQYDDKDIEKFNPVSWLLLQMLEK